jgi:hypothetical protein
MLEEPIISPAPGQTAETRVWAIAKSTKHDSADSLNPLAHQKSRSNFGVYLHPKNDANTSRQAVDRVTRDFLSLTDRTALQVAKSPLFLGLLLFL